MPTFEPIKIYHIEGRRSFRVIWLCEELSVPYTLSFKKGDIRGSLMEIRDAFPLMPLAPTAFYRGQWVVETGAIVDLILAYEGNGAMVPSKDSPDFIMHCQWMHFSEGSAAARMLTERFVSLAMGINPDALPEGYRVNPTPVPPGTSLEVSTPLSFLVGSRGIFDFMEHHLKSYPFFGGSQFSAADIMMHFPVQTARLIAWIDMSLYPEIRRWQKQVEARSSFIAARKNANPSGADEFGQPLNEPLPFPARPHA
jgi:glutathione S-transferase